MSNEIRKNNIVYASTSAGDHNDLKNVQGKGVNGEAYHLNADEYRFVQATIAGAPLAPTNLSPADGELNIYQYPEFTGSAYVSPRDVPMLGIEILIGDDVTLQNVIFTGYAETSQTAARLTDFEAIIETETTYFWAIRYVDTDGRRGNWSVPTSFTTAAAFEATVVLRPNIIYPAEGARVSPLDPMLLSSPFTIIGATDTHESSDWQISSHPGFDASHILAESLDDADNLTSVILNGIDMTGDLGFYARTRHEAANAGKSAWSPIRHALLREFHNDHLIGIGISEGSMVYWIDEQGNHVNVRGDYFANHPLYQFPRVIVADQYMRALPEVFVRCDHDEGGFMYRYWISPYEFGGSIIHPAYALSTAGAILFGEYLSGNDANSGTLTQLNSQPGKFIRFCSTTMPSADWLNTDADYDHKGWAVMSVYDRALLSLLMLVELRTFVFTGKIERNVSPGIVDDTSRPAFHGVTHPFFNYGEIGSNNLCGEYIGGIDLGNKDSTVRRYGASTDLSLLSSIPKQASSATSIIVSTLKTDIHPNIGPLQLLFMPDTMNGGGLGITIPAEFNTTGYPACALYGGLGARAPFPFIYNQGVASNHNLFARLVKRTT
ncbi:MAG: hypothetical protein LBS45_08215 [Synergistaceae bacterium]|jgi:hypothetical protein|nr:hypothetical protein [Synergistaceae bacterium]